MQGSDAGVAVVAAAAAAAAVAAAGREAEKLPQCGRGFSLYFWSTRV